MYFGVIGKMYFGKFYLGKNQISTRWPSSFQALVLAITSRDEHGSGLQPILAGSGLDRTAIS